MRLIVYDVEVFCKDWLVIFKDIETGKYTAVHNDNEELAVIDSAVVRGGTFEFTGGYYERSVLPGWLLMK